MLLYNSEIWENIQPKTLRLLNGLFNDFYRGIFRIGNGIPIPNIYRICGTYLPANIILQRKMNFTFHVANLPVGSLARDLFEIQRTQIKGLYREVKEHLDKLGIESLNAVSKRSYKALCKRYIFEKNKRDLINMAQGYKKIDVHEFENDTFKRKDYFHTLNLEEIRYKFRIENHFVATIRHNFPNLYRRRNMSLSCPSCRKMEPNNRTTNHNNNNNNTTTTNNTNNYPDTQNHLLFHCPAFSHLREELELDVLDDRKVIQFYKEVVDARIRDGDD